MANTPYKFRHVNEIVGTFVVLAVVLVVAGIFLMARAQRWFEPVHDLRVTFPAEGTFGVERGARIEILGAVAGRVDRIRVHDDGSIQGILRVRGEYARFLHTDSAAVVRKEYGVAGASYIVITVGAGAPLPLENAEIPIRKDTELLEMLQMVVEQIQEAVLPALTEVEKTLAEYRGLAADLRSPTNSLQMLLANLNGIAAGLREGEGTAGKILRDPAIADEARKAVAQVNELLDKLGTTLDEANGILRNVQKSSDALPEVVETVRGEMKDIPGVVLQARATLNETEKLLGGLQRHWLLRGSMEGGTPLDPIPPGAVGGGGAP
jgi:phospholipid/cholesterol/gamma-HCH transport system substrate-binding protein